MSHDVMRLLNERCTSLTGQIFTLPVLSATMNIRQILTSIFPRNCSRDVGAGCSGGCSEYRPVVYLKKT